MKTKLLISLVAILFVSVLYLLYLNFQKKPEVVFVSTPTPIKSIDPTANWKTYENKTYGYIFKYPANLQYDSPTGYPDSIFFDTQTPSFPQNSEGSIVPFSMFVANGTLPSYVSGYKYENLQQTSLIISGKSAIRISGIAQDGYIAGQEIIRTVITLDTNKVLVLNYIQIASKNFDVKLYDQILTTFKFTQ